MTPSEYRTLATTYREAGRDADADVCEILAQEAERYARSLTTSSDEPGHHAPAIVTTEHGHQYVLPGMEATT